MYDGYVWTTRVLIWQQEIMEILLLWSSAMLLPPIFHLSYFAMNIKATCSFLSLLASDRYILSKRLIKVLSLSVNVGLPCHAIESVQFNPAIHQQCYQHVPGAIEDLVEKMNTHVYWWTLDFEYNLAININWLSNCLLLECDGNLYINTAMHLFIYTYMLEIFLLSGYHWFPLGCFCVENKVTDDDKQKSLLSLLHHPMMKLNCRIKNENKKCNSYTRITEWLSQLSTFPWIWSCVVRFPHFFW